MRVYHFVQAGHGIEDIRLRRVKAARFHELNDPFELMAWAVETPSERHAISRMRDELSKRFALLCFSRQGNA